jgi:hypothetical protein
VSDEARRASLAAADRIDDAIALDVDRAAREILYRPDGGHTTFSLLTSVYARTDSELFDRTSASVLLLKRAFDEWVLLVNGPVAPDVERIVTRLSDDSRVKVIREPVNVGIVRAMRRCLEAATCEYVLPLDADDLLEPDIVSVLDCALTRGTLDFVYADEDILSGDDRLARFTRPPFDPVLNLETSYIWHPCAFRRACALELGVYSDAGAEYCHDWDTVVRFADARLAIGHVPHVLYHWRTHAASESHSGTQNAGSIASTRHLLRRVVARQKRPELYDVRPFPIFRGAEELYIARRPEGPPRVDLLLLTGERATPDTARYRFAASFPFHRVVAMSTSGGWLATLTDMAAGIADDTQYVAIVSDAAS